MPSHSLAASACLAKTAPQSTRSVRAKVRHVCAGCDINGDNETLSKSPFASGQLKAFDLTRWVEEFA
jgi:hypothetical protein